MLQLLPLVIALTAVHVQAGHDVHNVQLPTGQPYHISNDNYPKLMPMEDHIVEWNLQVASDAKIKFVCIDLRMIQMQPWSEQCKAVYMSVEDGRGETKACASSVPRFVHVSDGPTLKVRMVTSKDGTALFKCVALNMGDPKPAEVVKMDPHGRVRTFKVNYNRETASPYLDRLWVFESTRGSRMSFQCDISISNENPCRLSAVRFNNGETDVETCDPQHVVWFSKENKAKLRVQLGENGWGYMQCLVQAITGPNADEFENIPANDEDSSEYGVTPGTKQTSCKCGWSNKKGGRIIHGHEAGVNEYPWMVHMYVDHEVETKTFNSHCGASIITKRHILTAAHCLVAAKVAKPENIKLVLAEHDNTKPTGNEVTVTGQQVFIKQTFLEKGLDVDDIALIFIKETIEFSDIIGPICIEPKPYSLINRDLTIMGWGITEEQRFSTYLRKGKSRYMDPELCGASPWDVCVTSKPSSLCNGDSGGPLVWLDKETNRYTQISLVSRGHCNSRQLMTTLVAYYYDWIQEIIKATDPSAHTCHKI
uniref:Venom S1 protease 44 n=1 Tax=Oncocephalus sp. TaxID=2944721 RepID=A0AB38ZER6_9HEMI